MKILLIETEPSGHHISLYLNAIVDKLISKNHNVSILTSAKTKNFPSFSYIKKKKIKIYYLKKNKLFSPKSYFTIFINQLILYFQIKKQISSISKFDIIYLNTFTVIDKAISILGTPFNNVKFSGLFPAINFFESQKIYSFLFYKNLINKFLFNKLLNSKNLKNIFIPDPRFIKYSTANIKHYKKIKLTEDFAIKKEKHKIKNNKININRSLMSIFKNKNNFTILVYGAIRYEKGIQFLLEAASKIKIKKKLTIIIAGIQDDYTRAIINKYKRYKNFDLFSLNTFISYEIQELLFKKSNIVWTGYTKNYYGSSGVFFLSGKYEKPIISSNHGLISIYNKKYKTGYTVEIDNIKKIKKVLIKIISSNKKINYINYRNLNKKHNSEKFSSTVVYNLEKN